MAFLKSFVCIGLLLAFPCLSLAAGLEQYQFLKLAPQEQKAAVKTPEGKLELVGVGAVVAGDCQIVEIAEGRVVLERPGDDGKETIIVRVDGKHQRIERLRPKGEKPPVMVVPAEPTEVEGAAETGPPGYY
jgi:hypothetical protein